LSSRDLPSLTSGQVKELDKLATERFGVRVDWLMEAAGWQAARACHGRTVVVCGVGNNAGDGLAAARHLHRWGRLEALCCIDMGRIKGEARLELEALQRHGVPMYDELQLDAAEVILDSIFGTGLNRPPKDRFADWIDGINGAGVRVVSVDVPSGLDADTGVAYAPCVRADVTVTFTLPKQGLMRGDGPRLAGEVWVADIGVPFEAMAEVGVTLPPSIFAVSDVVRINRA
jgi:ADP-dependent NAD(P)H-hydrate dehydratase / NAD(P)H-hydrate epimerase